MPFRPQVPRALLVALSLAALAAAGSGCLSSGGPPPVRPPHCTPPAAGAQAPAQADAGPIAIDYLRALGGHRYDQAQTYAHACTAAEQHSLDRLWLWLDSMPSQAIKVADPKITSVKDGVTVRATLFARFGPAPYSAWVTLGPRTLRLTQAKRTWRVRADVSVVHRSDLAAYGVSWLHHPYFINGQRVTVVYAKPSDVEAAQQILDTAESVVPGLAARYGGGKAGLRPIIFLVDQKRQAERLAHVDLGKVRTPAGFQYSSFAYVDLPEWENLPEVDQDSMVAHELTHVVTRPMLDGAPHSLLEGIAMYEESAYLSEHGSGMSIDDVAAYYYHHNFPSMKIWRLRVTDWGLGNVDAIQVCYEDALVMTHVIMDEYGGVPALARLGAAFRRYGGPMRFTKAQVNHAFEHALGVPFARVVAEAHAYAYRTLGVAG
jgi:hypothetical protein